MKHSFAYFILFAAFAVTLGAPVARADDDAPDYSKNLTGDWGGARKKLYDHGVDIQANYWLDALHNASGGIRQGSGLIDNANAIITIDGEKLYGLGGSTISLNLMNSAGSKFNRGHVGSIEGIDNIEVPDNSFYIYEAWIQQSFLDDAFSVRAGMFDTNIEFNATTSSLLFMNPTFGLDTATALTGGINGPSTFPITALGARFRWVPAEHWVLQMAVMDGVSGDPADQNGTQIILKRKDGALLIAESAYGEVETGRVGVGTFRYTNRFDHLDAVDANGDPERRRSESFYGFVEKTLYAPDDSGDRHIDGFVRMAGTSGTTSQVDYNYAAGVLYAGPFASRTGDAAGFAVHGAHNSTPFRRANAPVDATEWGVETFYSAAVTPYAFLQPDIQFVHNPGANPAMSDAWVLGLRSIVNF